jgi:hypothetical protein
MVRKQSEFGSLLVQRPVGFYATGDLGPLLAWVTREGADGWISIQVFGHLAFRPGRIFPQQLIGSCRRRRTLKASPGRASVHYRPS